MAPISRHLTKRRVVLQNFIVKNLDTGESFHIDQSTDDYLVKTKAKLSMLTPADGKSGWSIIPECKELGEKKTNSSLTGSS